MVPQESSTFNSNAQPSLRLLVQHSVSESHSTLAQCCREFLGGRHLANPPGFGALREEIFSPTSLQ